MRFLVYYIQNFVKLGFAEKDREIFLHEVYKR